MDGDTLQRMDLKKNLWRALDKLMKRGDTGYIQAELATHLNTYPSNVSRDICAPLEERGLITREKEGRSKRCKITHAGRQALALRKRIEGLPDRAAVAITLDKDLLGKYIDNITDDLNPLIGYRAAEDLIKKASYIDDMTPIKMVYLALKDKDPVGDARIRLLDLLVLLLGRARDEGVINGRHQQLKEGIMALLCRILGSDRSDDKRDDCLFDLRKVPGEHNKRLLSFLRKLGVDFSEEAEIEPYSCDSDEGMTHREERIIIIEEGEQYIRLENTSEDNIFRLSLQGTFIDLIVRKENDQWNVYQNWIRPEEMSLAYASMKLIGNDGCLPCVLELCLQAMKPPGNSYLRSETTRYAINRIASDVIQRDPALREVFRDRLIEYKREIHDTMTGRLERFVHKGDSLHRAAIDQCKIMQVLDEILTSLP